MEKKDKKEKTEFKIFQDQIMSFGFKDRIRILFGKKVKGTSIIIVDRECEVIRGEHSLYVERFIKPKEICVIHAPDDQLTKG